MNEDFIIALSTDAQEQRFLWLYNRNFTGWI